MHRLLFSSFLTVLLTWPLLAQGLPEGVENSQRAGVAPPTPLESLAKMTVPEGFHVSLFAGEPIVAQPISMAFDGRGRLWVAECYSYRKWKPTGSDRILILEDTNGDGQFDSRKVFWDKGYNLTSIAIGDKGIWACCAPHLLFLPDEDGDDHFDGKKVIKLDGFDTKKVSHNVVNGLTWGPDGWLYGSHGILGTSHVGVPGLAEDQRVAINCGIWRYHPAFKKFEVVCHGTTNPWGLDFDEYGEGFFSNSVIGHLWHMIPGAHYKRMFGQDFDRHTYELLESCSDHIHWGGGKWTSSRDGKGEHDTAGGGHAHCGLVVYLGDNWPKEYRNRALMCNIHGNRLNQDFIERKGSGYVAKHGTDFLKANDPWFRGVAMKTGPDGGVYVSDWSDFGECHDSDGVHRSSGRIYKITYGQSKSSEEIDLDRLSNSRLLELQSHQNEWFVRQSRRILQQRAAGGRAMGELHKQLHERMVSATTARSRLRLLWALYVTGGTDEVFLAKLLKAADAEVRSWAIRLLVDQKAPSDDTIELLAELAKNDPSPRVRLTLASSLQRLELAQRWGIAAALVSHAEDSKDQNLPLMIWYGIEPAVAADKAKALGLMRKVAISQVRQLIAKRLAESSE